MLDRIWFSTTYIYKLVKYYTFYQVYIQAFIIDLETKHNTFYVHANTDKSTEISNPVELYTCQIEGI